MFHLSPAQFDKLSQITALYRYTRPSRIMSYNDMLDLILEFVDKYDNEFEEFVANPTNDDMS